MACRPATTGAAGTFIDRAGVCRDFTHLGLTLCRAAGIPARAVAAYALALDPPDFHAVFEVFLDGGWWLVDPTRLAPIAGMVRIAHGRDAADIAFLTTAGGASIPTTGQCRRTAMLTGKNLHADAARGLIKRLTILTQ